MEGLRREFSFFFFRYRLEVTKTRRVQRTNENLTRANMTQMNRGETSNSVVKGSTPGGNLFVFGFILSGETPVNKNREDHRNVFAHVIVSKQARNKLFKKLKH